jgi:hypothetical protein
MEHFDGRGLNQGSKQWGIFPVSRNVPERQNETQEAGKCIFFGDMAGMHH